MTRASRWLPYAGHLLPVAWLFSGSLFRGELPYFRDVSFLYYPNYVFLERSLRQGVWPLWNPTCDAGGPFLLAYPPELLLVGLLGAARALALMGPLHVLLAMCGASLLAGRLGLGPWGRWAAGFFFGASGYVLSSANLLQVLQGTALAPWVLAAFLTVVEAPTRRAVAALAVAAALQVSTLSGESALATALTGLVLLPRRPDGRALRALAAAGLLAALLAAPVLLGAGALLAGTRRGTGFDPWEALGISAPPLALVEAVVPRFLGDVHTFTERGYWGQLVYPALYPYFLSLYVGTWTVLLALRGGRTSRRLLVLLLLGVLLALGRFGPLEPVLALAFRYFRHPVKLALIGTIAIALLAARGLDRAASQRRSPVHAVAGLCAAVVLALLARWPDLPARLLAEPLPELRDERSLVVAREQWPRAFISSAALGAGASLALAAGSRLAPIAGLLAALDVLAVNTTLNPTTAASFYEPRPELQALLDKAKPAGPERWFSFGASNTAALGWSPDVLRLNSKVWYYYMNRQWLLPRSHILHGLDAAFDLERAGWEPQGATLAREERNPIYYPQLHRWLRLGNVRWVLAGAELPRALVEERGRASFPEIAAPLRLYEVRDPLPRAFWVPRAEGVRDAAAALERMFRDDFDPRRLLVLEGEPGGPDAAAPDGAAGSVRFEAVGPHGRRLHVAAPPGWVLVLEGFHPAWRAVGPQGPIQLRRGDGRYLAFRTPGGEQAVELRYAPAWRGPALVLGALGLTLVALVLARPTLSLDRGEGGALASPD